MKKLISNTCLLLTILLVSNCTVSKRHYRDGYQLSWHKNITQNKDEAKHQPIHIKLPAVVEINQLSHSKNDDVLYASTQKLPEPKTKMRSRNLIKFFPDSCGDIIVMQNGDEISAKVIEISQRTITYKSCENLGGPLFVLSKEKVFMIRYVNGTKEVFPIIADKPPLSINNSTIKKGNGKAVTGSEKKVNPMALASLISLGAFFLYFPLVLAPIFAVIACIQFKKHPDKYKAKGMVIPALIVGGIILTILVVALLVAIV